MTAVGVLLLALAVAMVVGLAVVQYIEHQRDRIADHELEGRRAKDRLQELAIHLRAAKAQGYDLLNPYTEMLIKRALDWCPKSANDKHTLIHDRYGQRCRTCGLAFSGAAVHRPTVDEPSVGGGP